MQRRPVVLTALVCGLAVSSALSGCAPDPSGSVRAEPSATVAPSERGATTTQLAAAPGSTTPVPSSADAPEALRFTATGVGGGAIDMAQYAGRPLVLWFWAPG